MSVVYVLTLQDDYDSWRVVGVYSKLPLAERAAALHPLGVSGPWQDSEAQPVCFLVTTRQLHEGVTGLWEISAHDLILA